MMKLFSDLAALRGSLVFVGSEELFIFLLKYSMLIVAI